MRERTQKHNNSVRDFGIFLFFYLFFCLSQFLVSLQKGLKRVLNKLPTNLLTYFTAVWSD